MLLVAVYSTIGLLVSSRTDKQIVALSLTALLAGWFFLIGAGNVIDFVGGSAADLLRAIGASSRFESIERGDDIRAQKSTHAIITPERGSFTG